MRNIIWGLQAVRRFEEGPKGAMGCGARRGRQMGGTEARGTPEASEAKPPSRPPPSQSQGTSRQTSVNTLLPRLFDALSAVRQTPGELPLAPPSTAPLEMENDPVSVLRGTTCSGWTKEEAGARSRHR